MNSIVVMNDFKEDLAALINKAIQNGIPCYIIDMIVKDAYAQVNNLAQRELQMAKQEEMKNEHTSELGCQHE